MKNRFGFRVWNKARQCFMTEKEIFICGNGELVLIDEALNRTWVKDNPNYAVSFCTGLKDTNGNLIYEGDVIVIPNHYPFYDYKNEEDMKQSLNETLGKIKGESVLNYVGIVENIYNSWQYVYHCVNPKKVGISEGINYLLNEDGIEENENSYFKVIGNIYTDAHLLEECKR